MRFREGDRVLFTSNTRGYSIGKGNPLVGTTYECPGKIKRIAGTVIQVFWDNGHSNSYRQDDLSPADPGKLDPNWAFRVKRINATPRGRLCNACGWRHPDEVTKCVRCGRPGEWMYTYICNSCGNELNTMDKKRCHQTACQCGGFTGWSRIN